jgi:hypothetical protein
MKTDVPERSQSKFRRLSRIALPVWLGSVVVAGTAGIVAQRIGGPVWINSVVVHFFQALGLCAMGLFVLAQVYAPPSGFRLGKVLKILGLVFAALTLLLGLWGLWGAAANLLAVLQ